MIGLVIVAHGRLAQEFVAVMEHIVGPQKQIAAIAVAPDEDMQKKREEILRQVAAVDSGSGVIILTDMFGGTPSNLAISVTAEKKAEAIAGINVPMLIKLASVRQTESLEKAAESAQEAGRKYINVASNLLKT
jgi:PTS system mannose-specific IIA component